MDNSPRAAEQVHMQTPMNPPGDSPVSLLSLWNLAELKDCVVSKAGSLSMRKSPWQSTALD